MESHLSIFVTSFLIPNFLGCFLDFTAWSDLTGLTLATVHFALEPLSLKFNGEPMTKGTFTGE